MFLLCALLLDVVAGLRSILAPAMVSWFARCGVLAVANTPLTFMGYRFTPTILTVFAVGELIADKLPMTPSRKAPLEFTARVATGKLWGAAIGAARHSLTAGLILDVIGAVAVKPDGSQVRRGRFTVPPAYSQVVVKIQISLLQGAGKVRFRRHPVLRRTHCARPKIEIYPLEKAGEANARMMSGKAQF